MSWFLFGIGTLFPVIAVFAAWPAGPAFAAKSRADGALALLDGILALALMRVIVPWAELSGWLWAVPVLVLAAAAVGLVWTWAERPAWRPGRPVKRTVIFAGVHVVVAAAILLVVL